MEPFDAVLVETEVLSNRYFSSSKIDGHDVKRAACTRKGTATRFGIFRK